MSFVSNVISSVFVSVAYTAHICFRNRMKMIVTTRATRITIPTTTTAVITPEFSGAFVVPFASTLSAEVVPPTLTPGFVDTVDLLSAIVLLAKVVVMGSLSLVVDAMVMVVVTARVRLRPFADEAQA